MWPARVVAQVAPFGLGPSWWAYSRGKPGVGTGGPAVANGGVVRDGPVVVHGGHEVARNVPAVVRSVPVVRGPDGACSAVAEARGADNSFLCFFCLV